MSLDLHPECISRLEELLTKNLRNARVNNEIFIDISSMLPLLQTNEALPKIGEIYERLQQYIGENPLFDFVYETLGRELDENGTYSSDSSGRLLSEFSNYPDVNALAARLISEFESLPWQYVVSFELPDSVGKQFRTAPTPYSLGSSLRIVAPDDTYDSLYPLMSGKTKRDQRLYGVFSLIQPKCWNKKVAYVQIDAEGFIGHYRKTAPLEHVLGTLKSFVGLSLATSLMKVNKKSTTQPFGGPAKSRLIVHRKIGDKWETWSTYELPTDISATLNALEIDDIEGEVKPERISAWIKKRIPRIATAFSNPEKAERVLLAAQWLLDSYIGTNELLSFVQTTVAMEIMLGEESKSDVLGIGELLRNRCAYLIGKSHSQREEFLADFDNIYRVRSKIVHRGKSRLSNEERTLFRKLQWMCRRVINEELKLIEQD